MIAVKIIACSIVLFFWYLAIRRYQYLKLLARVEKKRQQWREAMAADWAADKKITETDPILIWNLFYQDTIARFKEATRLPMAEIKEKIDALTCDWRDAYRYYLKCGDWPHPEACELIDKFGWEQAQGVLDIQNILNDRDQHCYLCREKTSCFCDLCDLPICDEHAIKIPDRVTSCTKCSPQKPD